MLPTLRSSHSPPGVLVIYITSSVLSLFNSSLHIPSIIVFTNLLLSSFQVIKTISFSHWFISQVFIWASTLWGTFWGAGNRAMNRPDEGPTSQRLHFNGEESQKTNKYMTFPHTWSPPHSICKDRTQCSGTPRVWDVSSVLWTQALEPDAWVWLPVTQLVTWQSFCKSLHLSKFRFLCLDKQDADSSLMGAIVFSGTTYIYVVLSRVPHKSQLVTPE